MRRQFLNESSQSRRDHSGAGCLGQCWTHL
jgi:hypothetical protein